MILRQEHYYKIKEKNHVYSPGLPEGIRRMRIMGKKGGGIKNT
jgi:hypothetical protein